MKYLILLMLTGCSVEIKSLSESLKDKKVEAQREQESNNIKTNGRCINYCAPYKVISFDPRNWSCQCSTEEVK
jgi:hypothetical protein